MNSRYLRNTTLFGHFTAAIIMNTLAPLLPVLQLGLNLTIFQSSLLPTLLAVSLMLSNLIMGIVISNLGQKKVLIYGLLLAIVGSILAFFTNSFILAIITYIVIGFAGGSLYTSLATVFAGLPNKYQNFGIYHASWGIGGMVSPLLITLLLNLKRDYHEIFLIHIVLIILLLFFIINSKGLSNQKYESFNYGKVLSVIKKPIVYIGIICAALYAATEVGSFTWSLNMSTNGYKLSQISGGYILSLFWFMFTAGRVVADTLSNKIGAIRFITISTVISSIVLILWLSGISPYLFPILGFTFGPIFPVIHKYVNSHLKAEERGLFNGLTYAGVGLTSTLMIPIMGSLGNLSMFLAYVPVLILSIILIFLIPQIKRVTSK